jgi:two-component system nitrogen regulation response regulator GlnG
VLGIEHVGDVVAEDYLEALHTYFGTSPLMRNLFESVRQLGKSRAPVILYGESGTGKELMARAVHMASGRKGGFLPFNVASLPGNMVELELFGYTDEHKGAIDMCAGGTLYIEGVENIGLKVQTRLLDVLRRMNGGGGMRKDIPRLICSSRRKLDELVREGVFLAELYDLLNAIPLHIPALRERQEDIPMLADYFASLYGSRKKLRFTKDAAKLMQAYTWPGNISELSSVVQRAARAAESATINADMLRKYMPRNADDVGNFSLPEAANTCLETYFGSLRGMAPAPNLYDKVIAEVEKPLIEHVLAFARGNQLRAADILGLNRNTLRKKIKLLNIGVKKQGA